MLKENRLVKGIRFNENFREAGHPVTTAKVYNDYGVDELIFLNIDGTNINQQQFASTVDMVSKRIFMPLTVGGGICSMSQIHSLLAVGADKVSINTAAVEHPQLIRDAAKLYGSQCIVSSVDYRQIERGKYRIFIRNGRQMTDIDPVEWALRLQENGCGEILLTSIDRDGMMNGYDIELLQKVYEKISIPLIASGGAGSLLDCLEAFRVGVSAISISSMFFFTDHSPIRVRSYLKTHGINVRASASSRN